LTSVMIFLTVGLSVFMTPVLSKVTSFSSSGDNKFYLYFIWPNFLF
jgi:hypothetical protein